MLQNTHGLTSRFNSDEEDIVSLQNVAFRLNTDAVNCPRGLFKYEFNATIFYKLETEKQTNNQTK